MKGQIPNIRLDAATERFAAPAAVREISRTMPEKAKRSDEELLRLARASAPDPSVFEQYKPVFIPSRISTMSLDAYYTRMHVSTLRNYAKEAAEGRAFLTGHNTRVLPVGYSLTGDLEENGPENAAVYSWAYVTPGREETDDLILAYKSGSIRDISVGFSGGTHICSICNNDIWDYEKCRHWPGRYYKVDEEPSGDGMSRAATEVLCYAWVTDAHLNEYSAVYDGATPDAVILKAQRQIENGQLDQRTLAMLNQRYRSLNLQLPARQSFVVGAIPTEERTMANENNGQQASAPTPENTARANGLAAQDERQLDVVPQVRLFVAKVTSERQMAAMGRKARQTAIDEAVKAGIRALGDQFNEQVQRALLENLSSSGDLTMVETMRANWDTLAQVVLPVGRQSRDEADPAPTVPVQRELPAEAYMV
jgi:hypothetical protein